MSSGSVARLNRALTAAELRRGFTGKITLDGRALVRVGNRVLAVPASRVGVRVNRVQSPTVASRWNASKRAAVAAEVQKLAATSLRNRGGGGRRPPGGGGGGNDGTGGKLLWTSWDKYPKVEYKGGQYAPIGDRLYARHAVERMQPSGLGYPAGASLKSLGPTGGAGKGRSIAPAYVEEVIKTGKREEVIYEGVPRTLFTAGTTTVVTEENGRIVVSIITR